MARLVYTTNVSLDGYTADADGRFDFAAPDAEVHGFINDLERGVGTYLYGRRLYETMRVWQTLDVSEAPPEVRDYAEIWRAAEKVVYSRTLEEPTTPRTRIERDLEPAAVRRLVDAADRDVSIGGPALAAAVLRAGVVDDLHTFVVPVVVGGGTRALPDGARLDLELAAEHRFDGGVVHLHHRVRR